MCGTGRKAGATSRALYKQRPKPCLEAVEKLQSRTGPTENWKLVRSRTYGSPECMAQALYLYPQHGAHTLSPLGVSKSLALSSAPVFASLRRKSVRIHCGQQLKEGTFHQPYRTWVRLVAAITTRAHVGSVMYSVGHVG